MSNSKVIPFNKKPIGRGITSPIRYMGGVNIESSSNLVLATHIDEIIKILKLNDGDYNEAKKNLGNNDPIIKLLSFFIVDKIIELNPKVNPRYFQDIAFDCLNKLFGFIDEAGSVELLKNIVIQKTSLTNSESLKKSNSGEENQNG